MKLELMNGTSSEEDLEVDVDDLAVLELAARRLAPETASSLAVIRAGEDHEQANEAAHRSTEEISSLAALISLLTLAPRGASASRTVGLLVHSLGMRTHGAIPVVQLDCTDAPLDGRVGRAVHLIVTTLLAGSTAGGLVAFDGHSDLEVSLTSDGVQIVLRDQGDDPPDRLAVGGHALLRAVAAARGVVGRTCSPGVATAIVRLRQPGAMAYKVAGRA